MDIKAELRLIKEKCPAAWDHITCETCPSDFDVRLNDSNEEGTYCKAEHCEECWNKAIESEAK